MSSATVVKTQLATALRAQMAAENLTIAALANKSKTGGNAIRRMLDKRNTAITLKTIVKTMDVLGTQVRLSVKRATPDELKAIAQHIVHAPSGAEAKKLKGQYLERYYG